MLTAKDDSKQEPSPKELFFQPRQLPYHSPDAGQKDGQTQSAQPDGKLGGKTGSTGKGSGHTKSGQGSGKLGKSGDKKGQTDVKVVGVADKSDDKKGELVGQDKTADTTKMGDSVGLRYSIVNDQNVQLRPDSEFHTGDRIKIRFESNFPGYLYIVNQTERGHCEATLNARISAHREYTLPNEDFLRFYDPAGAEKLIILFTRGPEPDFEHQVCSGLIDKAMLSRDIRIEKRPDEVYAINPRERVFLEIPLIHN